MAEEMPQDDDEGGGDGWIMTFADLMSLLMCFFVLLLSFSEMDVLKFKRLAGSMAQAFGVQQQLRVNDIPKGTSIIAQEFSPGKPDPTPLNQIWQKTTDMSKNSLDVACQDLGSSNSGERGDAQKASVIDTVAELIGETEQDAIDLANVLAKEIAAGVLELETRGRRIIVRIKEHGSFPSGSDRITRNFQPVLKIMRATLKETEGHIFVEGHTDDRPINTSRFPSNWALSSARAVSVAHGLMQDIELPEKRFTVTGHADTKPLVSNVNPVGRARNRRVEIIIDQGFDEEVLEDLKVLQGEAPTYFEEAREALGVRFNISPDEVF